jgi:hypothetical protein
MARTGMILIPSGCKTPERIDDNSGWGLARFLRRPQPGVEETELERFERCAKENGYKIIYFDNPRE